MKAHLISSDVPLREGRTYWAVCGAEVKRATYKFFFDDDFRSLTDGLRKARGVCEKCVAAKCFLRDGLIYGIVEAKKRKREIAVA